MKVSAVSKPCGERKLLGLRTSKEMAPLTLAGMVRLSHMKKLCAIRNDNFVTHEVLSKMSAYPGVFKS